MLTFVVLFARAKNILYQCRYLLALYRHCQLDPDEKDVPDYEGEHEYRLKIADSIKDVVFIVGTDNCVSNVGRSLDFESIFCPRHMCFLEFTGLRRMLFVLLFLLLCHCAQIPAVYAVFR